jgi:hypothetical protein
MFLDGQMLEIGGVGNVWQIQHRDVDLGMKTATRANPIFFLDRQVQIRQNARGWQCQCGVE